jgi:hypothetical protein
LRYADCPTVASTVSIAAPADIVWRLVSDITLPTRFSSELTSVEWLDGATEPAVGARFVGRSRHAAIGEWQTVCVVTAVDADRCFEWAVGHPAHPSSIWRFTISEQPGGGEVQLEQWFQMGPARSGLNLAIDAMPDKEERIVARRLDEHRANIEANLAGIKRLAEAGRS